MRIAYLIPGPMDKTPLGTEEMRRRQTKLRTWAFADTQVDVTAVDEGPASIESMYEEYLSIAPTAAKLRQLQKSTDPDAVIVGCFGDPGLDGLREVTDTLVVGPASASVSLALTLGHRFSFVTVTRSIVPGLRRLAWEIGALDALASVRYIEMPVIEINQNHGLAVERMTAEAAAAVQRDGADTLVLGCMSMGFLDVAEQMTAELDIPVLNPAKCALKTAEALVNMGLRHSRRAYMTPPKIAAGKTVDELMVR
jgi:allantoin racemase